MASTLIPILTFIGVVVTVVMHHINSNNQIRSSHALKVAEMRQTWINDLRDAMSEFHSYVTTVPDDKDTNSRELYEKSTHIKLLMNPKDKNYVKLERCMEKLHAEKSQNSQASHDLIEICQDILKTEWETLKSEIKKTEKQCESPCI